MDWRTCCRWPRLSIARSLLRRGCGVVLFTLGPLGAFAMTNDEPTLRRTLGRLNHGLQPSHVSRRAAFKAHGAIDTVGAGDAFLAGAVASLLVAATSTACWTWGWPRPLWRVDASRSSRPPRRGARGRMGASSARPPWRGRCTTSRSSV